MGFEEPARNVVIPITGVDSLGRAIPINNVGNPVDLDLQAQTDYDVSGNGVPLRNRLTAYADVSSNNSNRYNTDKTTSYLNQKPAPSIIQDLYYPEAINLGGSSVPKNIIRISIYDVDGGKLSTERGKYLINSGKGTAAEIVYNNLWNSHPIKGTADIASDAWEEATKDNQNGTHGTILARLKDKILDRFVSPEFSDFVKGIVSTTTIEKQITTKPVAMINLYAPNNIETNYGFNYNEPDLTSTEKILDFVGDLSNGGELSGGSIDTLKQLGIRFISGLINKEIFDLQAAINLKTRTIPLQNFEYLFDRVQRRKFNFSFQFYPKSKTEIEHTGKIITALKYYSHPEIMEESRYLNMPSVFKIQHMYFDGQGFKENLAFNRMKFCSLDDIRINYTDTGKLSNLRVHPGDFKSHDDYTFSSPVGTAMDLSFTELELLSRSDIIPHGNTVDDLYTKIDANKGHF